MANLSKTLINFKLFSILNVCSFSIKINAMAFHDLNFEIYVLSGFCNNKIVYKMLLLKLYHSLHYNQFFPLGYSYL